MSDNSTVKDSNAPEYHPSYSDEDASLVLSSSDGVLFRVHPLILRLASEVFKNMLSDAQDTQETIHLTEDSKVLKTILDFIYPNSEGFNLSGQAFKFVWTILEVADKYEINKVRDEFRVRFKDEYFLLHPLKTYTIACRYSWQVETSATSLLCLDHLGTSESWEILGLLDGKHALRLHRLISDRAMKFSEKWKTIPFNAHCWRTNEFRENLDSSKSLLLSFIQQELLRYPSGKSIEAEFWDKPEITFLISSRNKDWVKDRVLGLLKTLPTTVDITDT